LNNTANAYKNEEYNVNSLPVRVVERKIGRATFIVSSRFNKDKEKDIVSTIARLIQHDSNRKPEKLCQ